MKLRTKTTPGYLTFEEAKSELVRFSILAKNSTNPILFPIQLESVQSILSLLKRYSRSVKAEIDETNEK